MLDLQKASLMKRASAWLLDLILLATLACGFGLVLSSLLGYDAYIDTMSACYEKYEQQYGVDFDITAEDFEKLPLEKQELYRQAEESLNADVEAARAYNMIINLSLVIVSVSVLLSYLSLEFLVPLIFGNGQTVGKKVFGIALMRIDGVKLSTLSLFVRTVLGKYTVETMIPLLILMMMLLGTIGVVGPLVIFVLLVAQIAMLLITKTHSAIHDQMAATVAVDMSSQRIFETPEALMAYKKELHAQHVKDQTY
jgi:uncharacterized RDD family membrane protein YckC